MTHIKLDTHKLYAMVWVMRTSERSRKLSGVIAGLLPMLIAPYINPDDHGLVTITGVEVSGDLGIAKVFLAHVGGKSCLSILRKNKKRIAHEIAQRVKTRRLLELRFIEDTTQEMIQKLS